MAAIPLTEIHTGAQVATADGHDLGKVTAVYSEEFVATEGGLRKHSRSFLPGAVASATPDKVTLNLDAATVNQRWNIATLINEQGREYHVFQVGREAHAAVPYYDEVQTTTGGPPTGETKE
jgi:hypothetical protein